MLLKSKFREKEKILFFFIEYMNKYNKLFNIYNAQTNVHGLQCTDKCSRLAMYRQMFTADNVQTNVHGLQCRQMFTTYNVQTNVHGLQCTDKCSRLTM